MNFSFPNYDIRPNSDRILKNLWHYQKMCKFQKRTFFWVSSELWLNSVVKFKNKIKIFLTRQEWKFFRKKIFWIFTKYSLKSISTRLCLICNKIIICRVLTQNNRNFLFVMLHNCNLFSKLNQLICKLSWIYQNCMIHFFFSIIKHCNELEILV